MYIYGRVVIVYSGHGYLVFSYFAEISCFFFMLFRCCTWMCREDKRVNEFDWLNLFHLFTYYYYFGDEYSLESLTWSDYKVWLFALLWLSSIAQRGIWRQKSVFSRTLMGLNTIWVCLSMSITLLLFFFSFLED